MGELPEIAFNVHIFYERSPNRIKMEDFANAEQGTSYIHRRSFCSRDFQEQEDVRGAAALLSQYRY